MKKILKLFILLIVFLFSFSSVSASELIFSSLNSSYENEEVLKIDVIVSSPDKIINNISGLISFSENIEILSLCQEDSIINLWVQEPSFSNEKREINFQGVVLSPGFIGSSGKILTIELKTSNLNEGEIIFSSGLILANDGKGTNVLDGLGKASFGFGKLVIPESFNISSPTHINSQKWYNNNNPEFNWIIPFGVTDINILIDKKSQTDPGIGSDGLFSSYKYNKVEDGEWYFHIKLKNNQGWGPVSHFAFKIDTKNPESFEIKEIERSDLTDPKVKLFFDAFDSGSGISHFLIKINDDNEEEWIDTEDHIYTTPLLNPGNHILIIKAVDKAGNYIEQSIELRVEAINPPTIDSAQTENNFLIIRGSSFPDSQIIIHTKKNGEVFKKYITKTDFEGKYYYKINEKLEHGLYSLLVETVDQKGARNKSLNEAIVVVNRPLNYLNIEKILKNFLYVLSIFVIFSMFFYIFYKIIRLKIKKADKKEKNIENKIIMKDNTLKAFNLLKRTVKEHLQLLEEAKLKRQITEEEDILISEMKEDLEEVKKLMNKNNNNKVE